MYDHDWLPRKKPSVSVSPVLCVRNRTTLGGWCTDELGERCAESVGISAGAGWMNACRGCVPSKGRRSILFSLRNTSSGWDWSVANEPKAQVMAESMVTSEAAEKRDNELRIRCCRSSRREGAKFAMADSTDWKRMKGHAHAGHDHAVLSPAWRIGVKHNDFVFHELIATDPSRCTLPIRSGGAEPLLDSLRRL